MEPQAAPGYTFGTDQNTGIYKNYGSHTHGTTTGNDYTYQGQASYARKKPKVEEEVVDETVEEWEEEREDGTKVIVRKRTKRTKTTTTRDLYEQPSTHWNPNQGNPNQWNPNQWTTINTGTSTTSFDTNRFDYSQMKMDINDEVLQNLVAQIKSEEEDVD